MIEGLKNRRRSCMKNTQMNAKCMPSFWPTQKVSLKLEEEKFVGYWKVANHILKETQDAS